MKRRRSLETAITVNALPHQRAALCSRLSGKGAGVAAAATILTLLAIIAGWFGTRQARTVYTSAGYGGYVGRETVRESRRDPAELALAAFDAGRFEDAERAAERVIAETKQERQPSKATQRLRARWVLAFSAARQNKPSLARERFAALRQDAAAARVALANSGPRRGATLQDPSPGENPPTLEEEGAYQHAVLTSVLQDPDAAKSEYHAFMREYPESPLVHAAVKRIAAAHGGDVPPASEAVWKAAVAKAARRERERRTEKALCGPECLAELLRRGGRAEDLKKLAREMKTGPEGTTLAALAKAAERRGYRPRGLKLTWKGLQRQSPPFITLIMPGHFVLVERADGGVRVWNPSGDGSGKAEVRDYTAQEWKKVWSGVTLTVTTPAGSTMAKAGGVR